MQSLIVPDQLVDASMPTVARVAGLRYVGDHQPGIKRRKAGKGFTYVGPTGKPLTDPDELARIRRIAVPPAWTRVWICPHANGHIQAIGRDAKGRKQYRYHPRWRSVRDTTKYEKMVAFARALPRIRVRVAEDLARPGLPREKVLATVVKLLELTHIRVGNEEYARKNRSYGLTTMRSQHVEVTGSEVRFTFRGKSGKDHEIDCRDRMLARIVRRCQDLPGEELFCYVDESGETRSIESGDVNDYLREISGDDFTAKDFRTWAGTLLLARALVIEPTTTKRKLLAAIKVVADRLGNTPSVCRKCYVHPAVIDSYLAGSLKLRTRAAGKGALTAEEQALLTFLRRPAAAVAIP
jgi:DNA topoisomerase-1